MGREKLKTEHAGAKNGGGGYGKRTEVKAESKRKRRAVDRKVRGSLAASPAAARYHAAFTPDEGNTWSVQLVEKPGNCLVITHGKSIAQGRTRIREALAAALDDDQAAESAELVERFKVPEAKKLASIRGRREFLEQCLRELDLEADQAARELRAQGHSMRDVRELVGVASFVEKVGRP